VVGVTLRKRIHIQTPRRPRPRDQTRTERSLVNRVMQAWENHFFGTVGRENQARNTVVRFYVDLLQQFSEERTGSNDRGVVQFCGR